MKEPEWYFQCDLCGYRVDEGQSPGWPRGFSCRQCGADSAHRKEFQLHPKPLRNFMVNAVLYLVIAAVAWGYIRWIVMPAFGPAPDVQSTGERRQYDDYGDDDEDWGYDPAFDDIPHGY